MQAQPSNLELHPLPLPEHLMPKVWWEEEEITYFFSPFRSFKQNPSDRENKLQFWKPFICNWCEYNKRCTFTISELERTFRRKQLVPACLVGVIEDLLRNRQITTKDEFLKMPSDTWSAWAVDLLVKKPVGWSFRKAKELIRISKDEEIYVHLETIKLQVNCLLKAVQDSNKGSVLSKSEVKKLAPFLQDIDMILHWLGFQGRIATTVHKEEEIIKFSILEERVTPINDTDLGIYTLLQTEKSLSLHIEELEAQKLALMDAAKNYIKKGMKQMAKYNLQKRREIEKCLAKRSSVLENVQVLLSRIQESHSDAKILETYQQGLSALKHTMKEAHLTDDNVTNTMLEINEVLDIYNEVQESLANPVDSSDEQELERELEQLLITDEHSPATKISTQKSDFIQSNEKAPLKESFGIKDLPQAPQETPLMHCKREMETSS